MTNSIIARFNIPGMTATGLREVTSILDLETGAGNFIADAFKGVIVTDTDAPRNKGFQIFQSKAVSDRILCGQFDTINELLASMSAREHKANSLPIINITMPPTFEIYDGDAYRDVEQYAQLKDSTGKVIALVDKVFTRSSLRITLCAEDKPTVTMLASALATHLRLYTSKGRARFTAQTMLMGIPLLLNGEIENPKMLSFDAQTLPFGDSRVYAQTLSLDIVGEILQAIEVKAIPSRIEVFSGALAK